MSFKKTEANDARKLRIELAILRVAIFRSSPEVAQAYRVLINDLLISDTGMGHQMVKLLGELMSEANEAVGGSSFP